MDKEYVTASHPPSRRSEFVKLLERCAEIAFLKKEALPIRLPNCCELPNAPIDDPDFEVERQA